jgi:hypothetical protein
MNSKHLVQNQLTKLMSKFSKLKKYRQYMFRYQKLYSTGEKTNATCKRRRKRPKGKKSIRAIGKQQANIPTGLVRHSYEPSQPANHQPATLSIENHAWPLTRLHRVSTRFAVCRGGLRSYD